MTVAELVEREAELHPEEKPQVNMMGLKNWFADKGYHSGAVLEQVKELEVLTYIPEKKQAASAIGKASRDNKPSIKIVNGYGATMARAC
jgi:hypothetical protein